MLELSFHTMINCCWISFQEANREAELELRKFVRPLFSPLLFRMQASSFITIALPTLFLWSSLE